MVTGGDVLVEAEFAAGLSAPDWRIHLNKRDVTTVFRSGSNPASRLGLVTGLTPGANTLEIRLDGKSRAKLDLKNYPISGPVFSGPHQKPFICQTEAAGLGPPADANCSAEAQVRYFYWSSQTSQFKPLDAGSPRPTDIARTNNGTADFIVRKETGTINRAIYEIAFLHEPGQPLPTPWSSPGIWNGRLVYAFGGGCSAGYRQSVTTAGVMNAPFLSKGYAVASSTQNVFGNNCNDVLSAETLMMVKEYFIERFGVPRYTIGWGSSGGSMQQHLIGQNYPGLLDGIIPGTSYPDIMTVAAGALDCSLLANAFQKSSQAWTDEQKTAASGFSSWGMCTLRERGKLTWIPSGFSPGWVAPERCDAAIPKELVYDPVSNPNGIRCTLYDNVVNEVGKDPKTGHAYRLLDNVGVQYGLTAFTQGRISAEQFVNLNEQIGGFDENGKITSERTEADPEAIGNAYRMGRVNTGSGGLAAIPIIDIRPYLDSLPDLHDRFRSFSIRERLRAANGHSDNQVMFTMSTVGALYYDFNNPKSPYNLHGGEALEQMDRWLENIGRDQKPGSALQKVVRNKPAGLNDVCWSPSGEKLTDTADGRCKELFPLYGDPRTAAGAPIANDILKCTLKPIDPSRYTPALTTAQLDRLKAVFPNGVCDYNRPGVGQQLVQELWRTY